jgi:isoquinoline 1-oxidoreductase subunit beta
MNAYINRFEAAVSRRQVMIGAAGLSFAIAFGGRAYAGVIANERTGQTLSPWVSIAPDHYHHHVGSDRDGPRIDDLAAVDHR